MKKLTLLLCVSLLSLGAMARSIVFTLNDGKDTKVYYLLGGDTDPVLRFKDGKMTVNADQYELSDIKNFYVSEQDDPVGIESMLAKQNVKFSANTLVVNAADAQSVKVYTLGGVEVKADVQKNGDVISVNLNGLEKGTYVVNFCKSSMKVMKK
jgi:hypothetical protein